MAGHGSPPPADRGGHPGRRVDPASYTASGMHPEMAAEMGSDYEHNAMSELMSAPPGHERGNFFYTYKKDRPPAAGPERYLD